MIRHTLTIRVASLGKSTSCGKLRRMWWILHGLGQKIPLGNHLAARSAPYACSYLWPRLLQLSQRQQVLIASDMGVPRKPTAARCLNLACSIEKTALA